MQKSKEKFNKINYFKGMYIILFTLFLGLIFGNQINAENNSVNNPSISRFEIYSINDETTYLSNEEVNLYVGISLTETSGVIKNTILEIKIPKENITNKSFVASDINSQISKTVESDADYYIVKYELSPMASGTSLDIPIKFNTNQGTTPNGFEIPVIANFYDENQNKLMDTLNEKYTIITEEAKVNKYIFNDSKSWVNTNNNIISAGKADDNNPDYLTNELSDL